MTPELIKYAIALRGRTQRDIARECDIDSPSTVSMVINGRSRSKRIETRIAAITGMTLAELWPQWYGPHAQRRRPAMSPMKIAEALRALQATG